MRFSVCSFVVSQILSGESREVILENIHTKLTEVGEKVKKGDIPIELYHITKVRSINFVHVEVLYIYVKERTVRCVCVCVCV